MIKRSSLLGVLFSCVASTTLAQATDSDDGDTVDRHSYCNGMIEIAELIMESRQLGVSLEKILRTFEGVEADNELTRFMLEHVEEIALRSFDYPRVSGEARNELYIRFKDEVVLDCYRMF